MIIRKHISESPITFLGTIGLCSYTLLHRIQMNARFYIANSKVWLIGNRVCASARNNKVAW